MSKNFVALDDSMAFLKYFKVHQCYLIKEMKLIKFTLLSIRGTVSSSLVWIVLKRQRFIKRFCTCSSIFNLSYNINYSNICLNRQWSTRTSFIGSNSTERKIYINGGRKNTNLTEATNDLIHELHQIDGTLMSPVVVAPPPYDRDCQFVNPQLHLLITFKRVAVNRWFIAHFFCGFCLFCSGVT